MDNAGISILLFSFAIELSCRWRKRQRSGVASLAVRWLASGNASGNIFCRWRVRWLASGNASGNIWLASGNIFCRWRYAGSSVEAPAVTYFTAGGMLTASGNASGNIFQRWRQNGSLAIILYLQ
jgi:hypothetical protein